MMKWQKTIFTGALFLAGLLNAQGVEVEWRANAEGDLAGYKIYWGRVSGFYSTMMDVGTDTSFTLSDFPETGRTYVAVTAYDVAHNESGYSEELILENMAFHQQFSLNLGYPNPSNPSATYPYNLTPRLHVHIAIYDILGREVSVLVDETLEAGVYNALWLGTDKHGGEVASGTYFCRMRVGQFCLTRKIIVLH